MIGTGGTVPQRSVSAGVAPIYVENKNSFQTSKIVLLWVFNGFVRFSEAMR
jgi:hypothetical protein